MPLVADIHFQPTVAMMVADAFEKVRRRAFRGGGCVGEASGRKRAERVTV